MSYSFSILLHAHIREYMLCHSLVNTWLDANSHRSSPDAAVTVRLYVQNVLRPLGAFNLIPQVIISKYYIQPLTRGD